LDDIVLRQSVEQQIGSRFTNQVISLIGRVLFWQLIRDLSGWRDRLGAVRPSKQRHAGAGPRALFLIDLVCPAEEKGSWDRFFNSSLISYVICALDKNEQTSPLIPLFIPRFIFFTIPTKQQVERRIE